jgi:hypothetical protein
MEKNIGKQFRETVPLTADVLLYIYLSNQKGTKLYKQYYPCSISWLMKDLCDL